MTAMDGPAGRNINIRPGFVLTLALLCGGGAALTGCGSGSTTGPPPIPVVAPAILLQPADQSVPMGLTATYSVTATGSTLRYQWAKNGAAIVGATASDYVTPATAFADTGASFTVTVSNAAGTVASNAASLTVTARAPMAGDLRFQQVDGPATVNGWGNAGAGISTNLLGRSAQSYAPSLGTPFYVGSSGNCGTTPVTDGTGCTFFYTEIPFAASRDVPPLAAGYASDLYVNFPTDLQTPTWPAFYNGITPATSGSVITSLDLEPANVLFAVSWVQSAQPSGFILEQNTVTPANLQAAATQEGASSRVITAISNNGGEITYLSYGWQADTATVYEAQVTTASTDNAVAAVASLAAQGYILTASGPADSNGNIVLVGTRVQGDSMARPFVAAQGTASFQMMQQQGYAIVAVILNLNQPEDAYTYLGER
jgi:hypothetical protein